MYRSTPLVLLPLWLVTACRNDYGVGQELPDYPTANPPEVADVTQVDRIVQVTTPLVDILWMIDNSCSMSDEQTTLGENFPLFMNFFLNSGLDYHIGVTSSDIDQNYNGSKGKLVYANGTTWIDPATPEPVNTFVAMASLGTGGSGAEKGRGAIFLALEETRDTANAGFYRDDAAIHTVVISDEPDATSPGFIDQDEFIEWYDDLKDEADQRTFSTIVDTNNYGRQYVSIANQIGGIVYNILDENWPQVLERLGVQAAGLKREYFLSQLPVEDSLLVQVEDSETGATRAYEEAEIDPATGLPFLDPVTGQAIGDYTYDPDRNSITFVSYIPNPLSTVVLTYTLLSSQQVQSDQIE